MARRGKSGGGGSLIVAILIVFALVHYGHLNPSKLFNSIGSGGGSSSGGGYYNCAQVENLWVQAGGSPSAAVQMASIAEAESGGNPGAVSPVNTNGTKDYGLFQINSATATPNLDPMANAQEAVTVYNGYGYDAWSTYQEGKATGC